MFYRIGITELQRILLFEQLKSTLIIQNCPYIVKRSYLNVIFEIYINKVTEDDVHNETLDKEEVSDLISRIIIPDLDLKTYYRFLEGLANGKRDKELRMAIYSVKHKFVEKV